MQSHRQSEFCANLMYHESDPFRPVTPPWNVYMAKFDRVTPPKQVTSPTWSPPPSCKQALTKFQPTREWVNKVKVLHVWLASQKLNILTSQPYIPSWKHASRSIRARVLSIVSCFIKFNLSIIKKFLFATSSGGNNFSNRKSNKNETVIQKCYTVLGRTYTSSESITSSLFRSHCSKEVWESSSSMEWW